MIFSRILNTKIEDVKNLDTGNLLIIVRAFEDGQENDFNKGIFPAVVDELFNRGIICVW